VSQFTGGGQGLLGFLDSIVKEGIFFAAIGQAKISAVDIHNITLPLWLLRL